MDTAFVNLLDGLAIGGLLFVLAVGLTLIFGLVDVLNLAHGALYMAGGYLALAIIGASTPSLFVFVLTLVAAALVGLVLGGVLSTSLIPLRSRGHLDQALLTLGGSMIISEVVLHVKGRGFQTIDIPTALDGSIRIGGEQLPVYRAFVIVVALVLAAACYWFFERTRFGSVARAAIDDPAILASLGYRVSVVRLVVVCIGSALAVLAGVLGAPLLNLGAGLDNEVLTLALIVVVVGGLGSIKGAALGAILIGVVQNVGNAYVPLAAPYLLFGLMMLVLVVRPQGLFGRAA